ncbi:MAG: protein kinase [Proteobacteria bacterium]|nr:protein kinase [Pseudomonadota bacterium]
MEHHPCSDIGGVIGTYRMLAKIGSGETGDVYLGEHERVGNRTAIKLIRRELSRRSDVVAQCFDTAKSVNNLRLAGVAAVYDYGYYQTTRAYIISEYVRGESLSHRLAQNQRMSVAHVVELTRQIASTLAEIHERGIVHGRLKPNNVMLVPAPESTGGERIRLLDFGIARLTNVDYNGEHGLSFRPVPSPYTAPELADGELPADVRSDLFSLGCLLRAMIGGVNWNSGEFPGHHRNRLSRLAVTFREIDISIPASLRTIIARSVAVDPKDRYRSVDEFIAALDAIKMNHVRVIESRPGDEWKLPELTKCEVVAVERAEIDDLPDLTDCVEEIDPRRSVMACSGETAVTGVPGGPSDAAQPATVIVAPDLRATTVEFVAKSQGSGPYNGTPEELAMSDTMPMALPPSQNVAVDAARDPMSPYIEEPLPPLPQDSQPWPGSQVAPKPNDAAGPVGESSLSARPTSRLPRARDHLERLLPPPGRRRVTRAGLSRTNSAPSLASLLSEAQAARTVSEESPGPYPTDIMTPGATAKMRRSSTLSEASGIFEAEAEPSAWRRKRYIPWLTAGVALCTTILIGWSLLDSAGHGPAKSVSASSGRLFGPASNSNTQLGGGGETTSDSKQEPASRTRITIISTPPRARVLRGPERILLGHTPLTDTVPAGITETVVYLIEAPGYRGKEIYARTDGDREYRVELAQRLPPTASRLQSDDGQRGDNAGSANNSHKRGESGAQTPDSKNPRSAQTKAQNSRRASAGTDRADQGGVSRRRATLGQKSRKKALSDQSHHTLEEGWRDRSINPF